ncbi:MAG: HEAT repeat domain-containing protein [Caldilineaceae bacterium]|nr:HEAT repeat domain-containing protein [Caldilineaceae bacterium]
MHTFNSEAAALQALNDIHQENSLREEATNYLGSNPSPANLERLVAALEDSYFGVRWAAAVALAKAGEAALVPMLYALSHGSSAWLREGAHHVFCYSRNASVSKQTYDLLKAMRGPASDVATMSLASQLLASIEE